MSMHRIVRKFLDRQMITRVSYTLVSTVDCFFYKQKTAYEIAARAGFGEDEQYHIAMAVREAAVNAVLHGNARDPQKKFFVAYETTEDALVITITDQGQGLDASSLPDPLAPENLMKGTGRGIFLIRAFMDEVKFRNMAPGTEITLIKHVCPKTAPAKEKTQ